MHSINYSYLCVARGRLKAVASFAREKQPSDTVLYDPCKRIITNLSIRQYSFTFSPQNYSLIITKKMEKSNLPE